MKIRKFLISFLTMCLLGILMGIMVSAEPILTDVGGLIVGDVQVIEWNSSGNAETTGNVLPKGASYNPSNNTLTLQNCTLAGETGKNNAMLIVYYGERDLNLQILGENTFQDANFGVYMNGGGNLNVFGGGTLRAKNCQRVFGNLNYTYLYLDGGLGVSADSHFGISINGITVISDGCMIANALSTLSISNAVITQTNVNGYTSWNKSGVFYSSDESNYTEYALEAGYGYRDYTGDVDEDGKWVYKYYKGGGDLIIKNSTITVQNSKAAIVCRQYQLNGLNVYIGDGKAQEQLTGLEMQYPSSFYGENDDQYYVLKNKGGYLLITPETVSLKPDPCKVHKFGDYVTTTEPTVTTPGVATRTCTVCGTTETKELPKLKGTIKLSSSTLTVPVKQTVSAKALVGGMQKGDAIKKWQSANTKIATVDKNGNITGIAAGKVKIRVKLKSGASAILKVTVQGCSHSFGAYVTTTEPTVLKAGVATRTCSICGATETKEIPKLKGTVKFSTSSLSIQLNRTISLKALVGGMQKGDAIKTWQSADKKIATVDKNGNITGVAAGRVKIRVKLKSGASAILKVTVQKGTVATEAIQGLNKKLAVSAGKTVTLKPQLKPVSSTQKITYRSSDKKIVTVDANGVVKGVKAGTAKIQVKSGNVKFIIKVKVTK